MRCPISLPRSSTLAAVALVLGTVAGAFGGSPRNHGTPASDLKGALEISPAARILPPSDGYRFPAHQTYFFNADWQREFWGTNYRRLAAVKAKYDPDGLFTVHHGVGSEAWSDDGFTRRS